MTNIQNEAQKIHHQYGMSEMANYKIQLLCEQYAKEYHDSEVKKLNIPAVMQRSEQLISLLEKLLENNMCSHAGDELIEQMLKEINCA